MNEIEKLRDICAIQSNSGNWDYSDYMRGMANGLILAVSIVENKESKFFQPLKQYKSDASKDDEVKSKIMGWMHKAWR